MTAAMPKVGRPKGLRVVVCTCDRRVTGTGKSATCSCGRRITFPKIRRPKPKASA